MNCSGFQFLMSLNLDGRLSSARREMLLDHLAECGDCARLAEEMREAQHLALSLPKERNSNDFQETLWERIQSGEGTPDGAFYEPVPWSQRLRYIASGAAAAALFLVVLNWASPQSDVIDSPTIDNVASAPAATDGKPVETEVETADTTIADAEAHMAWVPSVQEPLVQLVDDNTFNATNVAQIAQKSALTTLSDLQTIAPRLQAKLTPRTTPSTDELAVVERYVRKLDRSVFLMRKLADEEFINLPGEFRNELRLAERGVQLYQRASQPHELNVALEHLAELNTDNINRSFHVVCCDKVPQFQLWFADQVMSDPEVGCVFFGVKFETREEVGEPVKLNPFDNAGLVDPTQLFNRLQLQLRARRAPAAASDNR